MMRAPQIEYPHKNAAERLRVVTRLGSCTPDAVAAVQQNAWSGAIGMQWQRCNRIFVDLHRCDTDQSATVPETFLTVIQVFGLDASDSLSFAGGLAGCCPTYRDADRCRSFFLPAGRVATRRATEV